jgi:hypothetical protein
VVAVKGAHSVAQAKRKTQTGAQVKFGTPRHANRRESQHHAAQLMKSQSSSEG